MGAAYFYHLTRRPLETVLAELLEKSLQRGWRVAVRGADAARLDWLDERLWTASDDGFLPHGRAGGAHDADQPVLLTLEGADNGAACLMSVDGAEVAVTELESFERVCVLFDGHDEASICQARARRGAFRIRNRGRRSPACRLPGAGKTVSGSSCPGARCPSRRH